MWELISFNWHLFRNTNLTYNEKWKKKECVSIWYNFYKFILEYFILLLVIPDPNTCFASKMFYFYVYITDTASKSLKQARKIVLLSHFMSKGLTKLDFVWL